MIETVLLTIAGCAAWLGCGALGAKFMGLTSSPLIGSKSGQQLGIVLGLIWLFIGFLDAFDNYGISMYLTRADRKNPFRDELREVIRLRRGLQFVPGDDASAERGQLNEVIAELREWPAKLRDQDGNRLVAAMRSEYETAKVLSRSRLEAFERIEQEITDEVRNELR